MRDILLALALLGALILIYWLAPTVEAASLRTCIDHALFARAVAEARDSGIAEPQAIERITGLIRAHPELAVTDHDLERMQAVLRAVYASQRTPDALYEAMLRSCIEEVEA